MAFPSVRSTTNGDETNSTAPTFNLPATISAGDLILVIAVSDDTATFTVPTGYTEKKNANVAASFRTSVFCKVAVGDEDSTTIDGTLSFAESSIHASYAIQDWYGSLDGVEVSTGATGSSAASDPDSITPSWGAEDTLFIAHTASDAYNRSPTAYPSNYTLNQLALDHTEALGGRQSIGVAMRQINGSPEDPGTFTVTSGEWAAITIAIRPAAAGGGSILKQIIQHSG